MPARPALRAALATGLDALGAHRGTALLVGAAGALTLGAALPLLLVAPRLRLAGPDPAPLPLFPPDAVSPALRQQQALGEMALLLAGIGVAALATGIVAVLAILGAQSATRASELDVHRAVGASRRTVALALLVEIAPVLLVALAAGALLGAGGEALLTRAWPATLVEAAGLAPLAFAAVALALLAGALAPMLATRTRRLAEARPVRLGLVLPALQLGASLAVLVAGALVVRTLDRAAPRDPAATRARDGFVHAVAVPDARRAPPAAFASLLATLHADRRVALASLSSPGFLTGLGTRDLLTLDCGRCRGFSLPLRFKTIRAEHHLVSPDSFRARGMRLVAGRLLDARDGADAPRVAVVGRALVERHFAAGALGREILLGGVDERRYTIVGIVEDVAPTAFGAVPRAEAVYLSVAQHAAPALELYVEPAVAGAMGAPVPAALPAGVTLGAAQSRAAHEAYEAAPLRWYARVTDATGAAMLLLALGGVFAMLRRWVEALRGELALHRALGARRWRVLAMVLLRASVTGVAGTAIGAWLGTMLWGTLAGLVPGLPAWDAALVLRHALLLVVAAMAGALLPALDLLRQPPARHLA